MKISDRIEPLVRNTIHAAVQQDPAKVQAALEAFPDDKSTKEALELALAITQVVLVDVYSRRPTDEEVQAVADEIVRAEAWAEPNAEQLSTLLIHLKNGKPIADAAPPENIVVLAFVSAANLLSSCHRDDEEWWQYLDRAEAALEAA